MTVRIGITGHQTLPAGSRAWLSEQFHALLSEHMPVCGVSSLAIGADQLFAECVLDVGGELETVVPLPDYEAEFTDPVDLANYRRLLGQSMRVTTLGRLSTREASFLAAGERVVEDSDFLVAVWNGEPAAGLGGTGDVVAIARSRQRRVVHLNPLTLLRSTIEPA